MLGEAVRMIIEVLKVIVEAVKVFEGRSRESYCRGMRAILYNDYCLQRP